MKDLLERLKNDLADEESRYAYADSVTNAFLTAQIKALREERELTQDKFAELVGTKQSGISRWQNSGYSSCKVETLRKFAKAFGVRLRITFEEFGSLPEDVRGFTKERLTPRKFADDPAFKEHAADQTIEEKELTIERAQEVPTPAAISGLWPTSVQPDWVSAIRDLNLSAAKQLSQYTGQASMGLRELWPTVMSSLAQPYPIPVVASEVSKFGSENAPKDLGVSRVPQQTPNPAAKIALVKKRTTKRRRGSPVNRGARHVGRQAA